MKRSPVWEETWTTTEDGLRVECEGYLADFSEFGPGTVPGADDEAFARARLAAAAPEMAQLLEPLSRRPYCAFCKAARADGHTDDCKLMAVLKKAGI
jgi:hypothetical protein